MGSSFQTVLYKGFPADLSIPSLMTNLNFITFLNYVTVRNKKFLEVYDTQNWNPCFSTEFMKPHVLTE